MRSRLTYSNVASTVALFLALTGGVVYAASKIKTKDIQRQAVTEKKIAPGAVKNGKLAAEAVKAGKLAAGAVETSKLAAGAVDTGKLADGAVGNAQVKDDSIQPEKLTFPVMYVAEPAGGSQAVPAGAPEPYPLTGGQWTQRQDAVNVVFGSAAATLAYDGSGSGSCQVFFDVRVDGQQTGGGQLQTDSTTPVEVERADRCRARSRADEPHPAHAHGPGGLERRLRAELDDRLDPVPDPELRLADLEPGAVGAEVVDLGLADPRALAPALVDVAADRQPRLLGLDRLEDRGAAEVVAGAGGVHVTLGRRVDHQDAALGAGGEPLGAPRRRRGRSSSPTG